MRAHVALKVKVGKFIVLLKLEQGAEGGIGVDLATISLILKVMTADVLVNLPGNLSASHLGSFRLVQENSKFGTNESWLDKTTWLAISCLALLLSGSLLSKLKLAGPALLKGAELGLE